jgi:hypothetical protein
MKRYLLYKNMVRGSGIGHMLMCYNNAIYLAMNKNLQLIVPRCVLGHNLGADFNFERFFGLDQYDNNYINNLIKNNFDEIEIIEYIDNGGEQSNDFTLTKKYFIERFLKTINKKEEIYNNHNVSNIINIAMHIRRGDIVSKKTLDHYKKENFRIFSDEWHKRAIEYVLKIKGLSKKDIHLNIYSELQDDGFYYNENGVPTDIYKLFDEYNCNFYLSKNMWECLYNMIAVDIFIGSRSGIPITASFFRDNLNKESYLEKQNIYFIKQNNFTNVKILEISKT